jgi:hypothetical protein
MKRAVIIMLVAMLSCSAAAWAQYSDPLLGPHNVAEKGCRACHALHNGAVMNGGTDKSTGIVYLWGRDWKTQTYTTFGGGSLTTPVASEEDPGIHTQMCLSCHDGGISDATMSSDAKLPNDGYSLENDHPVHVEYKPSTSTSAYNWNISMTYSNGSYRAAFVDATWVGGHPARLYVEQSTARAYVECSTCHNPHSFERAVFKIAGVTQIKTTSRFVRGWYDPADGKSKADFCRSCHLSKSIAYDGTVK